MLVYQRVNHPSSPDLVEVPAQPGVQDPTAP